MNIETKHFFMILCLIAFCLWVRAMIKKTHKETTENLELLSAENKIILDEDRVLYHGQNLTNKEMAAIKYFAQQKEIVYKESSEISMDKYEQVKEMIEEYPELKTNLKKEKDKTIDDITFLLIKIGYKKLMMKGMLESIDEI